MSSPLTPKGGTPSLRLILVIIFLGNFVIAQKNTWTLQKCIDKGLENSIQIQISQLEIKRIQKTHNSIWNQLLPTISFVGNQSYNFGSTIDPSTNGRVSSNIQNDNFYINANLNLIDFSAFANSQKNKIEIDNAKINKEIIENEYKLQLLESFYQALLSQELLKIQKEQFKNAVFNLDRISKEVVIGSKAKSDLYDIQFSVVTEEKRILETQQLNKIQKLQLFQLMNATDVLVSEIELISSTTETTSKVFAEIKNPKIKFATLNFESSLKDFEIQKAQNLPILSTFYNFSTFYYKPLNSPNSNVDSFNNQINDNKNQQIGIQLNVPIFNGFRNSKKSSAAKIETEKNKFVISNEKQKIKNQLMVEKENQENHLQLKDKVIETLTFAKASFETTQAKFLSGKIDSILFSSVKNQLLVSAYDVLKNSLQIQYIQFKINLIANNQL